MYRLLIVDDEPAIVKGLCKIFQEESQYEFEIYRAYSVKEALNIMEKIKLDILISDIHMPGQDGFELAEEMRKRWTKCKIIFLTGYNEFEYIYKAINTLQAGYILKSEDDSEILAKIERVVEEIDKAKKEQLIKFQEILENKQHENFIKAKCLESILLRSINDRDKVQLDERLSIDLKKKIIIYIGKLIYKDASVDQIAQLIYEIKKIYYEGFKEDFFIEIFEYQREYIVCLLQSKQVREINLRLLQISEEYQEIIMSLFNRPVSVIFSKHAVKVEQIKGEFDRLYKVLEKEQEAEVPKILEVVESDIEDGNENANMLISKLEKYIEENIGDELTLTKLASVIHLNPSYLSRYYRKITGYNLSDFIKQVKIEKSKALLLKSNKKIGEIAIELGFESQSYFCKVFKKCIGVSPVEFRRGE